MQLMNEQVKDIENGIAFSLETNAELDKVEIIAMLDILLAQEEIYSGRQKKYLRTLRFNLDRNAKLQWKWVGRKFFRRLRQFA